MAGSRRHLSRRRALGRLLISAAVVALAGIPAGAELKARSSPPASQRPNIVVIVLDDAGFADLGAFGSEIRTPHIDALARDGLRYNRFDSKAICSATRASLLTGRNNQTLRMEDLPSKLERPDPQDRSASKGEMPGNVETLATVLRNAGYAADAFGKWHLAPDYDELPGQNRRSWPLQRGFQYFYGFSRGWTDQYKPRLIENNTRLPAPTDPGYHFSVDITQRAIARWRSAAVSNPSQPRFLYLAYGAPHSPIQVPRSYIDAYEGVYDMGWDKLRETRLARQKALGIVPPDTVLAPRNKGDAAWDTLDARERRVFARYMATYAGFLTHTDEQIGQLIAFLKQQGQYENTLFVLLSDNGAASEGGPNGAFREHYADNTPIAEMDAELDKLGGPETHALYPRPWAMAGSTPFARYKLWPQAGGRRAPLIITWPRRITDRGGVRAQAVDVIDLAPTIAQTAGARFLRTVAGVRQIPVAGRSIAATWDSARAPTRPIQFFSLRGNRAIRAGRWSAVAVHRPGDDYAEDRWALFDAEADFSESVDLADRYSGKVRELEALWWTEARRYSDPPVTDPVLSLYEANRIADAFKD